MNSKSFLVPALALSTVTLGGCARSYGVKARAVGPAAGAGIAAVTEGDIKTFVLAGAAAGALAGYFTDKDDGCDGYDRNGYLDDDCFGTSGYPVDPR